MRRRSPRGGPRRGPRYEASGGDRGVYLLQGRSGPEPVAAQGPDLGSLRAHPVVRVSGRGSGRVPVAGWSASRRRRGAACSTGCGCTGCGCTAGARASAAVCPKPITRALITAAHQQLHAPAILIWDYVPRNIIPVVCPVVLCGQRRLASRVTGGDRLGVPRPATSSGSTTTRWTRRSSSAWTRSPRSRLSTGPSRYCR